MLSGKRRILVLGCAGSGKSRLSRDLGRRLRLPVIHLDAYYWRPGWVATGEGAWRVTVRALLKEVEWVMDGNYSQSLPERLEACDAVVFLDVPVWICLCRVVLRALRHCGQRRPDLGPECPER